MSYASGNFPSSRIAHALFSRCKSVVCLLWALGYISELSPYDQQVDPELTNELLTEPAQILIKKAVLRPQGSVEKQRDLAELWHWLPHSATSRIKLQIHISRRYDHPKGHRNGVSQGRNGWRHSFCHWGRLSCLWKGISGSDSCGILTSPIDNVGAAPCS